MVADAGILDRLDAGLGADVGDRPAGVLAELGLADPGDHDVSQVHAVPLSMSAGRNV
jgi:hypothetical protein